MKKTLKKLGFSLLGIVILLVAIGFLLPSEQKLEVSETIDAPMQIVFANVNDVRNWELWAPWKIADPLLEMTYSNPPTGKGAFFKWQSKEPEVGSGKLVLAEVVPQDRVLVVVDHETMRDFTAEIRFADNRGKTEVTWVTQYELGRNPMARYSGLFAKGALRKQVAHGLYALKVTTEKR
jgi:hypothetical protein